MARFLSPDILRILADAREKGGLSSLRAEAELLCVHHGELGGIIAQHWNLSDRIVTGIMYHHTPDLARDIVADVVHVANIAAKLAGTGHVATGADLQVSPTSLERRGSARSWSRCWPRTAADGRRSRRTRRCRLAEPMPIRSS
jgi:HD-like signal output (HDOD) protein